MKGIGISVVSNNIVTYVFCKFGSCFIMQLYDIHSVFLQ